MNILEGIHSRRSIRAFEQGAITDDQLHTILDAAMIAPSAGNAMPWHFVVVNDKNTLAKIPEINPRAMMASSAALAILVCGNVSLEKYQGFWVQDCSAATQNILLSATALGLGSVWTGVYPIEERVQKFAELFGLPDEIIPFSLIFLGLPAQKLVHKSRYTQEKISLNHWK